MKGKKNRLKQYLSEGILIVFSVLFALFITKLYDDHNTEKRKEIALESIQRELVRNAAVLAEWKKRHIRIRDRITSLVKNENDSLKNIIKSQRSINLGMLTDSQSLIDDILSDTAWESAKTTGIIAEFDFERIEMLTKVYTLQEVLTDKTLINILDLIFNTDTQDMAKLDATLIQFQLRFGELTGQEELMTFLYTEALKGF